MSLDFDLGLEALMTRGERELSNERHGRIFRDRLARLKEAHPDSWQEMVRVTVSTRPVKRY